MINELIRINFSTTVYTKLRENTVLIDLGEEGFFTFNEA